MRPESYQTLLSIIDPEQKKYIKRQDDKYSFFNNDKVTDHFAIIPTGQRPKDGQFTESALKVYQLIVERFVTAFGRTHIFNNIEILLNCNSHRFRSTFRYDIDTGFKNLFGKLEEVNEDPEDLLLSGQVNINLGDTDILKDLEIIKKEKTKPKYYTEATLLSAMETAGRTITDDELREAMKERGLGTPATKGDIIEKLKKREYIITKGKSVISTTKGRELIKLVDPTISSPEMTGEWEYKLKQMEKGKYQRKVFLEEIIAYVNHLDFHTPDHSLANKLRAQNTYKCPKCSKDLVVNKGGGFCQNKSSCGLKVWRKIAGKTLTDPMLIELITKGKTKKLKGFKAKSGKHFEARLVIMDKKVKFD